MSFFDNKLLKLMMDDMKHVSYLYRPTHHWDQVVNDLLKTINNQGIERFRETPAFLYSFIPTYAYPHYYLEPEKYDEIHNALSDIFPPDSKIEDSQTYTTHSKFQKRLKDLLTGRLHALSDYRVFLASDSNRPPYIKGVSESKIGHPIEQFIFDGCRYSRPFLNYLLGLNYLKNNCPSKNICTVLEIGGGYGSLGEIILSDQRNDCLYINIDIPPTSYIATYYLKKVLGSSEVADYSVSRNMPIIDIEKIREKYKAIVLCPWQLPNLIGNVDLFVNYHSFAEMEHDVVENYCKLISSLNTRYILLRNLREGKQVMKSKSSKYGVEKPILGKDYDQFFHDYKNIGMNTIPFGFKTEDNFHSEVRLYIK